MNQIQSKVSEINDLHNKSMDLCELAEIARLRKEEEQIKKYYQQAYELEKQAAMQMVTRFEEEPFRGIVFQSAANIAFDIGLFEEAKRMLNLGLAGDTAPYIQSKMNDLALKIKLAQEKDVPVSTAKIINLIDRLPEHLQSQAQDFVEFLAKKYLHLDKSA